MARLARRYHSTGINADQVQANKVFEDYCRFSPIKGKDILEIGPGQTLEVLEYAMAEGARSCMAVDVAEYISEERARRSGITYRLNDGKALPFESEQFDLIWSHTAFEHLRFPETTVVECCVLNDSFVPKAGMNTCAPSAMTRGTCPRSMPR